MSHTPHELHDEFPGQSEKIHALKTSDAHFARLADAYHEVNRSIHRMESGVDSVADAVLETAKKERLALKDQLAGLLSE